MILIIAAGLCLLSVPLLGGDLRRITSVRLHGTWIPVYAVAAQTLVTTIAPGGTPAAHTVVHVASYGLIAEFLRRNRTLPGLAVIATGAGLNVLAILANGGVMPAAQAAQRMAGLHLGPGFHNSVAVAHPKLLFLGDVIPWPGPFPNVLSVGDCLVYAGTLVLLHRICGRRSASERGLVHADGVVGDRRPAEGLDGALAAGAAHLGG